MTRLLVLLLVLVLPPGGGGQIIGSRPRTSGGGPLAGLVTSGLVAFWDLSTPYYNADTRYFTDLSGTGNALQKVAGADPSVSADYTTFMASDCSAIDSPSLSVTGDLTIEVVWIRTATGTDFLVQKGATPEYEYVINGGKMQLKRNATAKVAATSVSLSTWYHAQVSVSGTTATFKLNNADDGSGTVGTASDTGNNVMIGRSGTYYFTGSIARIRIYNRALSGAELTQNYNRDKAVLAARGISLP